MHTGAIMTRRDDLSRRGFLSGAAGAGALSAAVATLGLQDVVRADEEGGGTASDPGDGGAFQALALPPVIAGARIGVASFTDAHALNFAASTRQFINSGVYSVGGAWLDIPLELPVGSRLLRVDVYVIITSAASSASFAIYRNLVGSSITALDIFSTTTGIGIQQATFAPAIPVAVDLGCRMYLETSSCNSVNKVFLGAIYQYYDANPQLNLLPTPIRVYDSRAGANPTTVVKGQLANNATRVIDCTFGGAVPAGAAAAMITLTTVGTVGAGYMALWRNGLADPGTSSINWDHSGTNVAVTTVVALDAAAKLIAKTGPSASTDFIIDVIGFYA
jgi:hypothetical protein